MSRWNNIYVYKQWENLNNNAIQESDSRLIVDNSKKISDSY